MKTQPIIRLISLLLITPIFASAAISPGIKPSNIFYFLDTTTENIILFFTFNPENKAKKALEYADERLAEIEASVEEKNSGAIKTAITNYESNIALATEKSKEIKGKGQEENLLNLIADNASRNQEVLSAVLIKVPEEARAAIRQAIESSRKGQEEATWQIAELKSEIKQLKKEVTELKVKDETQSKTIEELNRQKLESALIPVKSPESSTLETVPSPKLVTPPSPQVEEKKITNITTLLNGAVVEMDTNGNILRYIKEAPTLPSTPTPVPAPASTPNNTASNVLTITLGNITTTITSAHFEWDTNKPTNSKIFITDSAGKTSIIQSVSGFSTHHIADLSSLPAGSTFSYVIEAIAENHYQKSTGSFSTKDDNLIFSASANKTSVEVGVPDDFVRIAINVKYLTKSLNGLVVNVTTPDSSQNKSLTLGNYQSATLNVDYRPKTVGQHTIIVVAAGQTQSITINAVPYVDIPPTLSLKPPQSGTTFIEPPQTSAVIATLACQYSIEKATHSVIPHSFEYEVISDDFTKADLSLKAQYANNPNCASVVLSPLPLKGGKFQLKITGLKFYAAGVESSALGLPITTVQYEVRDPNVISLWKDYVPKELFGYEGQLVTTRSPIVYVGGHSKATLQFNWTGPANNTGGRFSYMYTPCDSPNGCLREEAPTYIPSAGTPTGGETAVGSFIIPIAAGYNYAKFNVTTPPGGILNATLLLE